MIIIAIFVQPEVCRSRISDCYDLGEPYSPEMTTKLCLYLESLT